MPIYEFQCHKVGCPEFQGKIIDLLVKVNDQPRCLSCKTKLLKVMNTPPKGYVRGTTNYVPQK